MDARWRRDDGEFIANVWEWWNCNSYWNYTLHDGDPATKTAAATATTEQAHVKYLEIQWGCGKDVDVTGLMVLLGWVEAWET